MNFKFLKNAIKGLIYPWYEKRLLRKLDYSKTPHHIGIIVDGNRRWAKEKTIDTKIGHQAGADKILEFLKWCEVAEVKIVTIWLLSTDNFKRSAEELEELLKIIANLVEELRQTKRWSVKVVGALDVLPDWMSEQFKKLPAITTSGMDVNVAIGYGGRREIVDAIKSYLHSEHEKGASIEQAAADLNDEVISKFLYTAGQPDPDLLIRTSGEQRLGGFLLWQSTHSEFYFCEAFWPDFRRVDFLRALRAYAQRQRRFGS
ncbi:MAG: isoprenyl transferase [Candidatus Nanopelagicaceae bacterium]